MVKLMVKDENKEDKFKRLASSRTQKILNSLRLLGNCANKGVYTYNEDQVNKIFQTIDRETKRIKELFNKGKIKNNKFSL
jgi:hypothetical protein